MRNKIKRFSYKELYNRYDEHGEQRTSSIFNIKKIDFKLQINYHSTFKRNFDLQLPSAFESTLEKWTNTLFFRSILFASTSFSFQHEIAFEWEFKEACIDLL